MRRSVVVLSALALLAWGLFPASSSQARSIPAIPSAATQVNFGCSIGNPAKSYAGHCGLNLGGTVHLKAVTNHSMGGGYYLWITGRRVTPPPAVAASRTVCNRSPCLTDRFIQHALSVTEIVAYNYQAWLVFNPSGTPIVIKKSRTVSVAWAPKAWVLRVGIASRSGSQVSIHVALVHGQLSGNEIVELHVVGDGSLGRCGSQTFNTTSCNKVIDCSKHRSDVQVVGRVVDQGRVNAVSEALSPCKGVKPPPKPGKGWHGSVSITASPSHPTGVGNSVTITAKAHPSTQGTNYIMKVSDAKNGHFVYDQDDTKVQFQVPFADAHGGTGCPQEGSGSCTYAAFVVKRGATFKSGHWSPSPRATAKVKVKWP